MRSLLIRSIFAAVAALAVSSAAYASDLPVRPAYRAQTSANAYVQQNWTGLYIGLNAGYGWGKSQNLAPYNYFNNLDVSAAARGMTLGGRLGYRHQVNAFTIGGFGDFDLATMKGSGDSNETIFGFVPLTSSLKTSIDRLWSVRGELGWSPLHNVLLTGNVGFGGVSGNVSGNGSIFGTPVTNFDQRVSKTGLVYGAGAVYRLPNNWFASIDWSHYQAGSADVVMTTPYVGTQVGNVDLNVNVIKVGLNHKFDF
ncbi:MAG: outer membrane beta-barrel protein [Patescibacteria group bacterium]